MIRLLNPFRHRSFTLLWGGQTLSAIGSSVTMVALPWLVYDLTNSPAAMGSVMVLFSIPQLTLLLVGGVVVDRASRRMVMLTSDMLRGLIMAAGAMLVFAGEARLWHVYVIAMLFGAADAFFSPAYSAVVPELVQKEDLVAANSLASLSRSLAMVIGPLLGAGLVASGGNGTAFAFDAATFIFSALLLIGVQSQGAMMHIDKSSTIRTALVDGFRAVASPTWLWVTIVIYSLILAISGGVITVVLPQLIRERLGAGVGALGAMQSSLATGLLIGTVAIGQLGMPRRRGLWFYAASATRGLALGGIGLAPDLTTGIVLITLVGIAVSIVAVIWASSLQELVPQHLLGRVNSIDMLGSFALMPIGYAVVGVLAEALGPSPVFIATGLLAAGLSVLGLLLPNVRNFAR